MKGMNAAPYYKMHRSILRNSEEILRKGDVSISSKIGYKAPVQCSDNSFVMRCIGIIFPKNADASHDKTNHWCLMSTYR